MVGMFVMICVFGCKCFVHIRNDERSNVYAKSKQCLLMGYDQDYFDYRCL